ncbi:MFS transporter [Streptomyces sp. CAU 1734]|uniref:MFS transporter n=1 Tax=Streptomyces sp. CAU 1734 TaxID=3140360 RepID=UPI003260E046
MSAAPGPSGAVAGRPAAARFRVAVVFFVNGAVFASWGSRIPGIASALEMGPGEIAFAVFGLSVGALLGLPLSGALVPRFGGVAVIRAGLAGYAAALTAVALAPSVPALTGALVALGVGNGVLDVAMNAAAVRVERRYPRQIMAAFHAMFSFGGLAGALAGAGAALIGMEPAAHLPVVAAVLLVVGWAASFGLSPDAPEPADRAAPGEEATGEEAAGRPARRDRRLIALGLLAFAGLLCEGAAYDWSAVWIRQDLGGSAAAAALGFAVFTLAMACCRLVADRVADRVGARAFVRCGGLLAAVGVLSAVLTSSVAGGVAAFGVLGLALAGVVPTLFSAAAAGRAAPAPAIAVVSTIGYLGFLAGPVVIGAVAAAVSLRSALLVLVVPALAICAGAGALRPDSGGKRPGAGSG